jgi:hypothetical protein
VIAFIDLLVLFIISMCVLFVVTQIIVPIKRNSPLFPILRGEWEPKKELEDVEKELAEATIEAVIEEKKEKVKRIRSRKANQPAQEMKRHKR